LKIKYNKAKDAVVPVKDIKAYGRVEVITPHILKLGARWGQ
jgi:hypothetical protein